MKDEKEFKGAMKQGLYQVATVVRIYLDTHDCKTDEEIGEVAGVMTNELNSVITEVLSMSEDQFAGLVALESVGAAAFEEAAIKEMQKDGKPETVC